MTPVRPQKNTVCLYTYLALCLPQVLRPLHCKKLLLTMKTVFLLRWLTPSDTTFMWMIVPGLWPNSLTALCSKGGFQLTQWVSNSRAVLSSIPKEHRANKIKSLDLDKDCLPVERALGLQWCVDSDNFQFNINLSQKPHTRRGILSVVSSIFDPFGFLAPLILPAKQLLQELCQRGFGWDEPLPQAISA